MEVKLVQFPQERTHEPEWWVWEGQNFNLHNTKKIGYKSHRCNVETLTWIPHQVIWSGITADFNVSWTSSPNISRTTDLVDVLLVEGCKSVDIGGVEEVPSHLRGQKFWWRKIPNFTHPEWAGKKPIQKVCFFVLVWRHWQKMLAWGNDSQGQLCWDPPSGNFYWPYFRLIWRDCEVLECPEDLALPTLPLYLLIFYLVILVFQVAQEAQKTI